MRELKPCPFCGDLEETNDTGRVFYKELPHDARFLTTLDDAHLQIAQDNNGWVLHFEDDCGDRMFDIKISCCPICGRNLDSCANGVHPEIHNYTKPSQAVKALSLIVNRLVQKEYVPSESIVIVSDTSYENSILAGETRIGAYNLVFKHYKDVGEDEICFKTVEEFKGLESNVVIYLTHEFTNLPSSIIDNRKEYVAITRARYYLYVLNTKCKAAIGD